MPQLPRAIPDSLTPLYLARQCETAKPIKPTQNPKNIMEILCQVVEQQELQARQYEDASHQQKMFKSVGVILRTGTETLYVEAVQEYAEYLIEYPLNPQTLYIAYLQAKTRSYTDQAGKTRYQTDVRLQKIYPMC